MLKAAVFASIKEVTDLDWSSVTSFSFPCSQKQILNRKSFGMLAHNCAWVCIDSVFVFAVTVSHKFRVTNCPKCSCLPRISRKNVIVVADV